MLVRKYINNIFYDNYGSLLSADRNWNWEERPGMDDFVSLELV